MDVRPVRSPCNYPTLKVNGSRFQKLSHKNLDLAELYVQYRASDTICVGNDLPCDLDLFDGPKSLCKI